MFWPRREGAMLFIMFLLGFSIVIFLSSTNFVIFDRYMIHTEITNNHHMEKKNNNNRNDDLTNMKNTHTFVGINYYNITIYMTYVHR